MRRLILFVFVVLAGMAFAYAQPTITKPSAAFTEGCTNWISLDAIGVTENDNADFAASQTAETYVLQAPAGFEFNPGVGSVDAANGRDIIEGGQLLISVTASTITITITTDASANKKDTIAISGLQIKVTTATAVGSPYHITYDAGTATGNWNVADGTQHADLTVTTGAIESNATGGGNWSNTATWSGGVVPGICDHVLIKAGDVVMVDNDYACNDLEIENTATLSHDINAELAIYGNYTNSGVHNGGNTLSDVYLYKSNGVIDGTGTFSTGGDLLVMQNTSVAATADLTFTRPITIAATKTVTNNGRIITFSNIAPGTATWINAANSRLYTTASITTTLIASASGNNVTYQKGGGQNVRDANYYDLNLSGSGIKTLQGTITVGNNITINAGVTLATVVYHINLAGNWINNGGTFDHNNICKVTLNGMADQSITSAGEDFYDLTISNTGSSGSDDILLQDGLIVIRDITINDGDLNANGFDISVERHWNNTGGSFTHGNTNTVILNGSSADQNIKSNAFPFFNLTINNSAAAGNDNILLTDALEVEGNLLISSGDLNANGQDIAVAGNWTNTGGTFTHGGANKVTFNSSATDQTITSNTSSFFNLVLNNTGGTGNDDIILADALDIDKDLLVADGDLTASGFQINVAGDWTVTGGSFTHGNNLVIMDGASAQYITTNGSNFRNLTISNTLGNVILLSNIRAEATLDFTNGFLMLGNYNLNVNTITNANSSRFVVTNGVGTLQKDALTSSFLFPVGTATTSYTPLTLDNSAGGSGRFDVRVCNNVYDNGTCGGTQLTTKLVNKTWQVSTTSGTPSYDVTAQWNASDESVDFDRALTYISQWNGSAWAQMGSAGPAGGAGPYTAATNALTADGPIAVGGGAAGPLPIELLSFDALPDGGQVNVSWVTASETNNDYFTIEKSLDGIIFQEVARIPGAGNSAGVKNYSTVDPQPLQGLSYYRLKQTDFDGSQTWSDLVAVQFYSLSPETSVDYKPGMVLYPNPTSQDNIHVRLEKFKGQEEVLVVLMDNNGREFYSKVLLTNDKGEATTAVDPYQRLAPGLYMVIGSTRQSLTSEMLIVTR